MRKPYLLTSWLIAGACHTAASASLIHYTDEDDWASAVGSYTTITFTELPHGTHVTTQYTHRGIAFGSFSFIHHSTIFVNDLFGLHGPFGVHFSFDAPQHWVAIDHPGVAQFQLLFNGQVVVTSDLFPLGGTGNFSGVVSSVPFDEVLVFKPWPYDPNVFIDDLHWGAIPAPGAGVALLAWFVIGRRRRRQ